MHWPLDNRRRLALVILALVAMLLQTVLDQTRTPTKQRDYDLKLAAANLAARAFDTVREHRGLSGARLDLTNDPAGTGLIGPEISLITNATGDLEAKLTSLNPNFAAVFVEYFRRAGLRAGDPVAVGISGSFPGMNICLFAALETMELRPVVVSSVGASNWGANSPDFTWLDMESLFVQRGVFHLRNQAATYGGGNDMGRGLSPTGRQFILDAMDRNQVPLLASTNIEDAISKRMAFYETASRGRLFRMYVNVGGGVASLGSGHNKTLLKAGLGFDLGAHNWARKGTLILFAEKGAPVVHILKIAALARRHGLPVAPDVRPEPGEGEIFTRDLYRWPLAAAFLVFYSLACMLILAPEWRQAAFKRLPRWATVSLLAGALLLTSLPTQAAERWSFIAPAQDDDTFCIADGDQTFQYSALAEGTPLELNVHGPRRLKIICRLAAADTVAGRRKFGLTVRLDGEPMANKSFSAPLKPNLRTCETGRGVTSLRRVYVNIPKGPHLIQISARSTASTVVICRVLRSSKRRAQTTVPFAPERYLELATLQFESGNQSTYYRFDTDNPLTFTVAGPTRLQVYSRLDFQRGMLGRQKYTLEVWRDGELWRTFHYDVKKLANGFYPDARDILPGTRKRLHITVPKGAHTFTVRCVAPAGGRIAAQIRLPEKDLAARP